MRLTPLDMHLTVLEIYIGCGEKRQALSDETHMSVLLVRDYAVRRQLAKLMPSYSPPHKKRGLIFAPLLAAA